MKKRTIILWIAFLLSTFDFPFSALHSSAAEIRLKYEPIKCTDTLVTLANVAEIISTANDDVRQTERLQQTVLFTAPTRGERRTIERIELRDILSRLGFGSVKYPLTGADRIVVVGELNNDSVIVPASYTYEKTATNLVPISSRITNPLRKESVTPQLVKTLEQQISEAIIVYLSHCTTTEADKKSNSLSKQAWKVSVKLTPDQARLLATSGQIEEIFGGSLEQLNSPVSRQRFGIRMQGLDPTTQQNVVVTVDAAVELLQQVVVLRRSLPKGCIIGESDVTLKRVENLKEENFFVHLSDVVGQETTNSVRELSVLTSGMIKKPTWVHKGEIVTVRLLNNGISVRTVGVAQNDGTQGDIISIETIQPNTAKRGRANTKGETSTFLARVCEPKTVEVFASGVVIEN